MPETLAFTEKQQRFIDDLVGSARVKARKLVKEEFEAAAGNRGEDAQEALILKRIGEAEEAARTAAKAGFDAEAVKVAEKAAEDAAAAKLADEKKWEELATQHSTKIEEQTAELEPLKAKVTAYEALVADMLKDRLEALGDAAKAAVEGLPGEPGDLDKLVWLNQNEGLFEGKDPKAGPVGTPSSKGRGKQSSSKTDGKEVPTPDRISRWPLRL